MDLFVSLMKGINSVLSPKCKVCTAETVLCASQPRHQRTRLVLVVEALKEGWVCPVAVAVVKGLWACTPWETHLLATMVLLSQ